MENVAKEGKCECRPCTNPEPEEEKNDEGAPVKLVYDIPHNKDLRLYRYFCGRKVGKEEYFKPCSICDGTCGPSDGCQCKSCYRYQFEQKGHKEGVKRNDEDAVANKSLDTVHQQMELYYCGRKACLKCLWENACEDCVKKETCGPENGCQCKSCVRLQYETEHEKQCVIF